MNALRALRHQSMRAYRSVAARPSARRFNEALFDLSLHGLGIGNFENDVVSGEKHFIGNLLVKRFQGIAQPTVVDVGAHDGAYAELILANHPQANVVCVEPHPASFQALASRLGDRATTVQCALGSEAGELTLFDRGDESGSQHASLYEGVIRELHGQAANGSTVEVRTLDDLVADRSIDFVDLLKIDTEGHELSVLIGGSGLVAKQAIGVVQIEFNEMNVYSRSFLRDFRQLLPGHRPFRLLPHGLLPIVDRPLRSELFGFQNIVFLTGG